MIGLIWNLSFGEIFVVGALAVMVFGGRLPEVAARVVHAVKRFRRSLDDLKRETGIEQELRNIDYEIRQAERAAHAPVPPPQDTSPTASSSSDSAPAVEAPPGFRQARRVQGISPDLSPGATPLAGGEEDRSGLVAPSSGASESTDSPAAEPAAESDPESESALQSESASESGSGGSPEANDQSDEPSSVENEAQTQKKDASGKAGGTTPGPE